MHLAQLLNSKLIMKVFIILLYVNHTLIKLMKERKGGRRKGGKQGEREGKKSHSYSNYNRVILI